MNSEILNRGFRHAANGFYQIEAKGYHPATLGKTKVVQVIDAKALGSIADKFGAESAAGTLRHGKEMLIDREHFSSDPSKETTAYGWMQQVEARDDGLYARIRWSGTGKAAVDGGDYRFFSTEYDPADLEDVPEEQIPPAIRDKFKGARFVRPMRLDGLTLTNMPNNRGQKPITNRSQGEAESVDDLAKEREALKEEVVTLELDAHGVKQNALRKRLIPILMGMDTKEQRIDFLETVLRVREQSEDEEQEQADAVMNRANELRNAAPGRTFDSCWNQAQHERLRNKDTGVSRSRSLAAAPAGTGGDAAAAARIRNRAEQLRQGAPARTFDSCWNQALSESLSGN